MRDVAGRHVERELEDLETESEGRAYLVDRGAACGEIQDHLACHVGWVSRDTLRHDAMIAGEDRHEIRMT